MRNKLLIQKKIAKDAGYALFLGTGVLCILSFLSLSALALARFKIERLSIQSTSFYSRLSNENEQILAEWKKDGGDFQGAGGK